MFHLGPVVRAKIVSMGAGASHVVKKNAINDDEENEGFGR
jgi:hypothetical protein